MSEYSVKEMHLTLQGEGAHTGRAVVLLRFTGCNLSCPWCDTDHSSTAPGPGGGVYSHPKDLADAALGLWTCGSIPPTVLCTGGEPLLQLDASLIREFGNRNCHIHLETNGTMEIPQGIHWVTVSPKYDHAVVKSGNEVKLVWPSGHLTPDLWVERDFDRFWLQPLHDENYDENLQKCIRKCLDDPRWSLGIQTHRYLGIP